MSISLVIIMYAVWTSMFALGKMTVQFSTPLFVTSVRMLFAGIILLTFLFLTKKGSLKLTKKQIIPVALLALFSIYLTNALEIYGLQHLSSAKTCFIYSLTPFCAAFFSYIHFGEKMTSKKWIGFGIGLLGVVPGIMIQSDSRSFFHFSWPELAVIGAVLCSVYGWVLLRVLVKDDSLSPVTANGYSMLLGGLFAIIHSFFIDVWSPVPIQGGQYLGFFQGILWMTLISNIICYNLYGMLLKKFTATFLSFMGLLSPFFASLSGWLLIGEKPTLEILASTAVVVIGLWFVYQEELKQGYIIKTPKVKSETT